MDTRALQQRVETVLAGAQCPAVLFSGGKDSLLLLALARESRSDIQAIWFRTDEPNTTIRKVLRDWNITAWSWDPADVYLLAQDGERVIVHEYDLDGTRFPVVTDLAPGTTCSRLLPPLKPVMATAFDVLLWGARDDDAHWLRGSTPFPPDGCRLGNARLYAPLRDLTTEQVLEAVADLGLTYTPQPDALPMCSACMETDGEVHCPELNRTIPAVQVDWRAGVRAFRTRFLEA